MAQQKIGGLPLAYGLAGLVLFWSGLKGTSLKVTVTDLLKGRNPPAVTEAPPSIGVTGGTGSTGSTGPAPGDSGGPAPAANGCSAATCTRNKSTGKLVAASYGWSTGTQWNALNGVVMLESGWCNTAQNPSSTAYGIGQFLDTTWATVGYSKTSDPRTQIEAMLKYIKQRYGTPEAAYQYHLAHNSY